MSEQAESWLFAVSRNRAINLTRGKARRRTRERTYAEHNRSAAVLDPAQLAVRSEELARIQHCLMELNRDLREALFLKVVEGVPCSRLAERSGIAKSTVSRRVSEGLVQLSRCFHGVRHGQ